MSEGEQMGRAITTLIVGVSSYLLGLFIVLTMALIVMILLGALGFTYPGFWWYGVSFGGLYTIRWFLK